jgi:hypothetical protein
MFTLKIEPPEHQRPSVYIAEALRHAAARIEMQIPMGEAGEYTDPAGTKRYAWTFGPELPPPVEPEPEETRRKGRTS